MIIEKKINKYPSQIVFKVKIWPRELIIKLVRDLIKEPVHK